LILQQRKADLAQAMQKMQRFWPDDLDARPVGLDVTMGTEGYFSDLPSSAAEAAESVSDQLPAIAQYVEQVQAAQAALRMTKGLYWPSLDLVTSRQYNTETAKQDFLTQLQLNMPLYSGGSVTAQVKAAEQQLKASQLSLEEARLVQREKAVLAWQDWSATRTRAEVGTTQSDIGEKVVQGYRQQFKLAKRSLLDLLNIQADSFGYRSAAVSAFHEERIARARLLASIGQLAARFTPQAALAPSENTPS
jgi:adhesin transport system outer membrane protein